MKKAIQFVILALTLGLMVPAAFTQQPTSQAKPATNMGRDKLPEDVPAELNSAIEKLKSAKNDLAHAGGEWGGYRQKAMSNIDQALKNLYDAVQFAKQHKEIK